ncbi:hypothetical protein KGF57_005289 [Candida theae]|uniref:C2H2-type domain-containing protein n=1 Tax=Candida theae TaxID=1198502 RepID=A0AAD5B8X3_9ASCO|nr:uncharacterized protein KGF57_005289 [Candida theae]KAI5948678.1 hypothetical protein KGF57_005289 [Candida theae]
MVSSAPTSPIIANLLSVPTNEDNQQEQQTHGKSKRTRPYSASLNQIYTPKYASSVGINNNGNDHKPKENNYTASSTNISTSNNYTSSPDSGTSEEENGSSLRNTDYTISHDDDESATSKVDGQGVDTKNFGSKTASGHSRIFNCKLCQRAFTREEHLTRHVQSTHNKLKPFVCGICSRPFSRRDLLLRHAKNLHDGSEKAINRIRRSYKNKTVDYGAGQGNGTSLGSIRVQRGGSTSDETEVSEEDNEEEQQEVYTDQRVLSSSIKNNKHRQDTNAGASTNELTSPIDESPESKRLKMSVNMLVS